MHSLSKARSAWGKLELFLYHPTQYYERNDVLKAAEQSLNSNNVNLIKGEIHTDDGRCLPFTFDKCGLTWLDAVGEDDL